MNWWMEKFGMPDVESYAQLREHYDKTPRWRGSQDRPFGLKKYNNRRMRMLDDQSIELEYYGHPLVRWHPDGTISVFPHQRQRQGIFDSHALPQGLYSSMGTRTGPILMLFANGDTRRWIQVPKPPEQRRYDGDNHAFVRNDNYIVLKGDKWLHLRRKGSSWVPVDKSSLTPFEWREPDAARRRALAKEYRIPELVLAARALLGLGATDVLADGHWSRVTANPPAADKLLAALKDGDFPTVLRSMRAVTSRHWDPVTGTWLYDTTDISGTDVKALRDRLCVIAGACDVKRARILAGEDLRRVERRLKDFGAVC